MKILTTFLAMLAVGAMAQGKPGAATNAVVTTVPTGLRLVTMDGKEGATAPAQEEGKDGIARIHKVDPALLELHPAAGGASRGTIMVCPGGGYGILAVEHEGRAIAKLLNDCGYDAAILLYHVSAGKETRDLAIEDAKAGLALLRAQGAKLGLKTDRIGAMGFSAGGHLAARLAHETAAAPLDLLVLMYPAYLEKDGAVLDDVAPAATPAFVYVAGDDHYSPSSKAFAAACEAKKIPCELHVQPKGGHGFGLKATLPEGVRDWPDTLRAFLKK